MQNKRSKRSRIRAAKPTAGHGARKKHRGSGNRGGFGKSAIGKRSSAKIMKITKGQKDYLGKRGFKLLRKKDTAITLMDLQERMPTFVMTGLAEHKGETYTIDLGKAGYTKLLSKGRVVLKMNIKVQKATTNAVTKVSEAGGQVILNQEEQTDKENNK